MRDRLGIEAASGAAILGMMADDALIAVVHFDERRPLTDRDRNALSTVKDVLTAVEQLSSRSVATPTQLKSMAPLAGLDETFQAVTNARGEHGEDVVVAVAQLRWDIEQVLEERADADAVGRLRAFLDRLADVTLARSEALARPGREHRAEWTKTVSP
ncbi:MAG: hypothetical protein LC713_06165 [Actinobacteria bacterium]|nr:hypothetical protein [Actinomycetota bacterium]